MWVFVIVVVSVDIFIVIMLVMRVINDMCLMMINMTIAWGHCFAIIVTCVVTNTAFISVIVVIVVCTLVRIPYIISFI